METLTEINKADLIEILKTQLKAKTLWHTSVKDQPFTLTGYSINGKTVIIQEFTKSEAVLFYFPESFVNPYSCNSFEDALEIIKHHTIIE